MALALVRSAAMHVALFTAGLGLLAGCLFDDDINQSGRVGVTLDDQGDVMVLLHVCEVDVNRVLVFRDELLADLKHSNLGPGRYEVPLADPGSEGWKPKKPVDLSPAGRYDIGASDSKNGDLAGITASSTAFAKLDEDKVLVGEDREGAPQQFLTRKQFDGATCADVEYDE